MSTLRAHSQRSQGGFAIVAAIFLLVVLAALGAFMLTLSNTQHLTSTQDVQGSRTYWAARAGIQWAASRIKSTSACASGPVSLGGFSGAVTVTCTSNTYTEGLVGNTKTIYWVESTATAGGGVGSISRTERVINAFIEF